MLTSLAITSKVELCLARNDQPKIYKPLAKSVFLTENNKDACIVQEIPTWGQALRDFTLSVHEYGMQLLGKRCKKKYYSLSLAAHTHTFWCKF